MGRLYPINNISPLFELSNNIQSEYAMQMCPANNLMGFSSNHFGLYRVYVIGTELSRGNEAEAVCSMFHLYYIR